MYDLMPPHERRRYQVYYVIHRRFFGRGTRDSFRWSFHIPSPIVNRGKPPSQIELWWPQTYHSIADARRGIAYFQDCVARATIGGPEPRPKPGDKLMR